MTAKKSVGGNLSTDQILKLLDVKCAWTIKKVKVGRVWLVSLHVPGVGEAAADDAAGAIKALFVEHGATRVKQLFGRQLARR